MNIEDEFNEFIKKWCSSYAHLSDSDENDGEAFREKLREMVDKDKVNEAIDSICPTTDINDGASIILNYQLKKKIGI